MADSYRPLYYHSPEELRPTAKQWLKHGLYFLLTFFTATIAGMTTPFGKINALEHLPAPANIFEWLFVVPFAFFHFFAIVFRTAAAHPFVWGEGLIFSSCLMAILTAHEFGHYIACRLYGVKSTLPYFIPLPMISPAGTLGAVIKIQSPMMTLRAIFDIGVAGPLAGFAVIIPVAIAGLATMEYAPPTVDLTAKGGIVFADPLLTRLLGALMNVDPTLGKVNPFYSAAWVGLLVTSLNLLPAGQLDGGHAVYAVLGEKKHFWIGRVAFGLMVVFTVLGYELYGVPSGLLFTILLGILLKIPHPPPLIDEPLDAKRKIIAVLTLIVFVLSFMPFPILKIS